MRIIGAGGPGDPLPPVKPALDVAGYLATFIPDAVSVTREEYQARLETCAACIYRTAGKLGFRCAACGCFIAVKATVARFNCPQSKWPGDPPPKP
jgi:hypothetical protein